MKSKNTNRGITLIALIITIIVMLILVAVTISMAVNGGLFEYAGKAVGETQSALNVEQELSNGKIQVGGKWYASIDDYLEGKVLVELPEGLKVGDYVNYTPTTGTYTVAGGENGSGFDSNKTFTTETGDAALKWRVLSIDETTGKVELIAATENSQYLFLGCEGGYNHGVDILNDLCEALYSNENGAIARSINVEDINEKTSYNYEEFTSYLGFIYGDTKRLSEYGTTGMYYPNLYSQEVGYGTAGAFNTTGLNGSEGLNDGVENVEGVTTYNTVTGGTDGNTTGTDPYVTFTGYSYKTNEYINTNLGINTAPKGLFLGSEYWVATRCVIASSSTYERWNYCLFKIRYGELSTYRMVESKVGAGGGGTLKVRPVVSLGSNVTLTKDTTNSTDTTTYWNIEY